MLPREGRGESTVNTKIGRRGFLKALAGATGSAMLAGCAPKVVEKVVEKPVEKVVKETVVTEGTPKVVEKVVTAKPAPKQPVTIVFGTLHPTWLKYCETTNDPAFEKEFPNIKVKRELTPGDQYIGKILAMHAAGTPFDVIHIWNFAGWEYELVVKGVYKNLEPLINRDKYDMNQFFPAVLDHCRRPFGTYMLHPVHADPGPMGVYWNKNLLEKAGVPEPRLDWTYADLAQTMRDVNKALNPGGKMQIATLWGLFWDFNKLFAQTLAWGGGILDKEGRRCLLGEEPARQLLTYVDRLINVDQVVQRPNWSTDNFRQLFASQKLVFIWHFMALAPQLEPVAKEAGFEMGMGLAPIGPAGKRGANAQYQTFGIHSDSKYQMRAGSTSSSSRVRRWPKGSGLRQGT
jgi:ABC-type glycerol-3-phosphate transport system substrate-binding protein